MSWKCIPAQHYLGLHTLRSSHGDSTQWLSLLLASSKTELKKTVLQGSKQTVGLRNTADRVLDFGSAAAELPTGVWLPVDSGAALAWAVRAAVAKKWICLVGVQMSPSIRCKLCDSVMFSLKFAQRQLKQCSILIQLPTGSLRVTSLNKTKTSKAN